MRKVERGDPSVALGTAFEAATLVGVPLFHHDAARRSVAMAFGPDGGRLSQAARCVAHAGHYHLTTQQAMEIVDQQVATIRCSRAGCCG